MAGFGRLKRLVQTNPSGLGTRTFHDPLRGTAGKGTRAPQRLIRLSPSAKLRAEHLHGCHEWENMFHPPALRARLCVNGLTADGVSCASARCNLVASLGSSNAAQGGLRRTCCVTDYHSPLEDLLPKSLQSADPGDFPASSSSDAVHEAGQASATAYWHRHAYKRLLFPSPVPLMWHRGVLELLCSSCRYVVRRWHVPILGVDCNANPRHKQALTSPPPRSRGIPKHLTPYLVGKQAPRHPRWRQEHMIRARATHLNRAGLRRNG